MSVASTDLVTESCAQSLEHLCRCTKNDACANYRLGTSAEAGFTEDVEEKAYEMANEVAAGIEHLQDEQDKAREKLLQVPGEQ